LEREFQFWNQKPAASEANYVESVVGRLQTLKKRLQESQEEESRAIKKCRARIEHLNELMQYKNTDEDGFQRWSQQRLYRLVVDHLLRMGYFDAADKLAKSVDICVHLYITSKY
jgi:macrophage erythroblast attacher